MKQNDKVVIRVNDQLVNGTLVQKRLWGWVVSFKNNIRSDTGAVLYVENLVKFIPIWRIWPVEARGEEKG